MSVKINFVIIASFLLYFHCLILISISVSLLAGTYVSFMTPHHHLLYVFIHSFIHPGYFYSAPSTTQRRSHTARILCRSFTPKRHRQMRVKDLSKVPTWRLERDLNPRLLGRKATNLPCPSIALYTLLTCIFIWQ